MAIFSAIASAISGLVSSVGGGVASAATAAGTAAGSGVSGLAALTTAASGLAGTAVSFVGQQRQQEAAERMENIRQAQMDIESTRARRQMVRQAIVTRAQALSNATAQGASEGSGLAGGLAQITSSSGQNIAGINQGQQLGHQMFAANRQFSQGQTMQSIGQGISGFGNFIANNWEQANRVWQNF